MNNFDLPPAPLEQLQAYAEAVRTSPHNLLSKRALEELWDRHIAESVAFARSLPERDGARSSVLDVGTGGGLPGMVIAIVRPDLDVTLLDATTKKMDFLGETAALIGASVTLLTGRAEELVRQYPGHFDIVTARAVATLDQLVAWALPFVRPGGQLHAIKGQKWREELRDALPVIERLRGSVIGIPQGPQADQGPECEDEPKVVIIRAAG
jgi:16S rRNA (guanine527-N7)-methyltransferase